MSIPMSFIEPYGSFHRRYEIVHFIENVDEVKCLKNLRKTSTPAFKPKELIKLRARPDEK